MKELHCEYCGQVMPHQPWDDGLVECRNRLRAHLAEEQEEVERLTKDRDAWKAKWEDLDINRAVCCYQMEKALALASRWLGSGAAGEDFESIGDWFYRETGMLRPGKSMPLECGESNDEERTQAFREWCKTKAELVRSTMREALCGGDANPKEGT